jgi:D-3-phosphoglycerate dehydrogenase
MTIAGPKASTIVHIDPVKPDLPLERDLLAAAGVGFTARKCASDEEVVELARGADGILCLRYTLGATVLDRLAGVRVIVRYGIGVDNIDLAAATGNGIAVCNVPDYCIDEVATHAMTMLLALNRKIVQQNAALRGGPAVRLRSMGGLRGETLGLIGYGRLARAVAERARAFGLRIVAFDHFLAGPVDGAELLPLEDVLRQSDYVSVHVPLTDETSGLIGADQLDLMKPTSYLVSTARGDVVDEVALHAALTTGGIAGAGLDVWSEEPVRPDHPLLALDNVIGTSHTAFYSDVSVDALREGAVRTALGVLDGTDVRNVVNPAVLDR